MIATGIEFIHAAKRVRAHIDQRHRYAHILRVARTAAQLARAHGGDARQARTAGLLHDLARLYSGDRLIRECEERGMPIDAFERAHPVVLHARLGAELARDEFGVNDEAILSAIRKHTVAAATMSPLDEIVYLADGLEPGRDFVGRAETLALAFHSLAGAMRRQLTETLVYQESRQLTAAPELIEALAHYHLTPPGRNVLPELVDIVRAAAEDKKGEEITVLDLEGRTTVADAFVVVTGRSKIQTRSIADAIIDAAKENGFNVARTEGYNDGGWILIDLADVVAHVFTPDQRAFYNLERLWGRVAESRAAQS